MIAGGDPHCVVAEADPQHRIWRDESIVEDAVVNEHLDAGATPVKKVLVLGASLRNAGRDGVDLPLAADARGPTGATAGEGGCHHESK